MRVLGHMGLVLAVAVGPLRAQEARTFAASVSMPAADVVGFVLGSTTLTEVRQIFAERGNKEALASARAPRRLTPRPHWNLGNAVISPVLRVDETRRSPALYFDAAERLVLVVDPTVAGKLTRTEFERKYHGVRVTRAAREMVALEAPLERCVAVSALFRQSDGTAQQVAYGFTCPLPTR